MNGGTKILTVSYGAFSCTLEGFDDPFTTMKAIADYFSDLAAEDRQFGAEPPLPDSATLHRIAERAARGRVEAHIEENGVTLRATGSGVVTADSVAERLLQLRSAMADASLLKPRDEDAADRPADPAPAGHAPRDDAARAVARALAEPEGNGQALSDRGADRMTETAQEAAPDTGRPRAAGDPDAGVALPGAEPGAIPVPDPEDFLPEDQPDRQDDALPEDLSDGLPEEVEQALQAALCEPADAAAEQDDDAPLRALIAEAKAEQDREEAAVLAEKLDRARARVVRIRTEADPHLLRELARIEQDLAPHAARPDAGRQLAEATGEDAVERILDKTTSEMRAPESRRRISALSHLKAAVAATVAERLSGGRSDDGEADRLDAYRDDLARVVRPAGAAGPAERPAPLVLVSEQRVDGPPTEDPVAPDAVAIEDEDEDEDNDRALPDQADFSDFVRSVGATNLGELIQAAAAYAEVVEKRPHVSRPHLLRCIAGLAPDGATGREAALRSFGTLLRDGMIEKVRSGQFALTDRSSFRSAARRLAR